MPTFYVAHDREFLDENGKPILWRPAPTSKARGAPEVYVLAETAVKITPALKQLILDLNPGMKPGQLRSLLDPKRAFNNTNRRKLDKVRVCGGAILHGEQFESVNKQGEREQYLRAEMIDSNKALPSAKKVLEDGDYFECVVVKKDGSTEPFPQMNGKPVLFPQIAPGGFVDVRINEQVPGKPDKPWIRRV